MVLDEKRIGAKAIFRVNGTIQKPVIIRRDVAESILRRSMLGIKLECVEAERLQSGRVVSRRKNQRRKKAVMPRVMDAIQISHNSRLFAFVEV